MNATDVLSTAAREVRLAAASRSVLVGLIGSGIQASRTPALHEREGAAQGLAYVYKIIDLDTLGLTAKALPELLTAARRFGFAGLNITHPCKQSVIPLLDELSPDARALGAVNTVVFGSAGRTVGHNTDWSGFAESFKRGLPDAVRHWVVQFGAGGAGAAVAHALLTLGVGELSIVDTGACQIASERFEDSKYGDEIFCLLKGDANNHRSPIGQKAYEAFDRKNLERFAKRRSRHAKSGAQGLLWDPLPRAKFSVEDHDADQSREFVVEGLARNLRTVEHG